MWQQLVMKNHHGDCWEFTFKLISGKWEIQKFTDTRHDLLAPPYDKYFKPKLKRIIKQSNKRVK